MRQITFTLFLTACMALGLNAQVRYVDSLFSSVNVQRNVVYGANIAVLTGAPMLDTLRMDVYTPVGDTARSRPVVLYFHTGSFLPQYFNGGVTGAKHDSTAVTICSRLAKRGFVAISVDYRLGWNPVSTDQNVRTGTLLQAAYRGVQDGRTCVRFLRRSVAEQGNPFGVNPDQICAWGQGTGGYITQGMGYLDEYSEIQIDKFLNTTTLEYYVDTTIHGNVTGTNATFIQVPNVGPVPFNIPNHVGYSSDISMVVNMGGAMGDIDWLDPNKPSQPELIGFHVVSDPFAPFSDGAVIVPVTNQFVVNVSGTRSAVAKANEYGVNKSLDVINAQPTLLNLRNKAYQAQTVDLRPLGGVQTTLAVDNMYPFVVPGFQAGPWDWWDTTALKVIIPLVNAATGQNFNADKLNSDGRLTNPDISKDKALRYIDTVMTYFTPRACNALGLASCQLISSTENLLQDAQVNFKIAPNPAEEGFRVQADELIKDMLIFDMSGRIVQTHLGIQTKQYEVERVDLPAGVYIVKARFDNGVLLKKVVFR